MNYSRRGFVCQDYFGHKMWEANRGRAYVNIFDKKLLSLGGSIKNPVSYISRKSWPPGPHHRFDPLSEMELFIPALPEGNAESIRQRFVIIRA